MRPIWDRSEFSSDRSMLCPCKSPWNEHQLLKLGPDRCSRNVAARLAMHWANCHGARPALTFILSSNGRKWEFASRKEWVTIGFKRRVFSSPELLWLQVYFLYIWTGFERSCSSSIFSIFQIESSFLLDLLLNKDRPPLLCSLALSISCLVNLAQPPRHPYSRIDTKIVYWNFSLLNICYFSYFSLFFSKMAAIFDFGKTNHFVLPMSLPL